MRKTNSLKVRPLSHPAICNSFGGETSSEKQQHQQNRNFNGEMELVDYKTLLQRVYSNPKQIPFKEQLTDRASTFSGPQNQEIRERGQETPLDGFI